MGFARALLVAETLDVDAGEFLLKNLINCSNRAFSRDQLCVMQLDWVSRSRSIFLFWFFNLSFPSSPQQPFLYFLSPYTNDEIESVCVSAAELTINSASEFSTWNVANSRGALAWGCIPLRKKYVWDIYTTFRCEKDKKYILPDRKINGKYIIANIFHIFAYILKYMSYILLIFWIYFFFFVGFYWT